MASPQSRDEALALDERAAGMHARDQFVLRDDRIYLAGHSLGPPVAATTASLRQLVEDQWADALVGGWNQHGWIDLSRALGDQLASLLGAPEGSVMIGDSTSIQLFELTAMTVQAAARERGGATVRIAIERHAFPGDRYVVAGLQRLLGDQRCEIIEVDRDQLQSVVQSGCEVAIIGLVDFRSAHRLDLAEFEAIARRSGCRIVWDLCHAVGAIELELAAHGARWAVGCTYKYLNAGPGAPAFVYLNDPELDTTADWPAIAGWFGHARPFEFAPEYEPAPGVARLACGTPSIIAMHGLSAALSVWRDRDRARLRGHAIALAETFLACMASYPALAGIRRDSPDPRGAWGSHLSFHHDHAFAIVRCLARRGVIGDFRGPDSMRFAICPLYTRHVDMWDAVQILDEILRTQAFLAPQFQVMRGVP